MKEQLISFETAKLAKEKGFNINPQNNYYYPLVTKINGFNRNLVIGRLTYYSTHQDSFLNDNTEQYCFSPTQSLLQKWLREKHFIHVVIIPTGGWTYKIVDIQLDPENKIERPPYSDVCSNDFCTYEEALEYGLKESLNLITV